MRTIKDIAKEADVSAGTVDRVLHNRSGVSIKTREKVQAILNKYDFQTNVLASALAFKKKFTIATITPKSESNKDFWCGPNKGIQSATEEIKKYGVNVQFFNFDQFDPESYNKTFLELVKFEPNAVLIAPVFYESSINLAKKLEKKRIPYVFINIHIRSRRNISYIGQNSFQSGYLSGKLLKLILADKDDILIVKFRKDLDYHFGINTRVKGFLDYFEKNDTKRRIKFLNLKSANVEEIRKGLINKLHEDLRANGQIGGIFLPSSYVYLVAQVLDDTDLYSVKLVGYDIHKKNIDYLKKGSIDFLIDQDSFDQGYKGVKILFEYLFFNKTPEKIYNSPINIITKENIDFVNRREMME